MPLHGEEARGHDDAPVGRENLGPDDDIGDASLVFERHEDDALRRSRPLAHQNEAGNGDDLALLQVFIAMLAIADDAAACEIVAEE